MKKILLFIGVASLLSLASCIKDRNCVCVDQSGYTSTRVIMGEGPMHAKTRCSSFNYENAALSLKTTCTIQ